MIHTPGDTANGAVESRDDGASAVCVFAPVLLLTVTLETRGEQDVELHVHCGGQGYWVARMARILGAEPVLCTVLGGETGQVIEALMDDGISLRHVTSPHASAGYVHDRRDGERREVAHTNPLPFGRHEHDQLHNLALGEAATAGVCALAGTHDNETVPTEVYERLTADLRSLDVDVVTDITGEILRAALRSGIDLVKLSDEELVLDGWATGDDDDDLCKGMDALRRAGARDVVISRGERGLLAWYDDMLLRARTPQLSVADPRGAGDSMTAALTVARKQRLGMYDVLRLAAAAAAVNVTRHGLASGDGETIKKLVPHVDVEQVR
jgi:1-phosphofructokinase